MIKKILLIVLSLALFQGLLFVAGSIPEGAPGSAPDFTLLDLEDKQFSLSDSRGKPLILFFWTTWCPYCRKELGLLDEMSAELSESGIGMFAINAGESSDKVSRFIASFPVSFRILLDTDYEVARAFGVAGVPTYILVNKEGNVVFSDNQFPQRGYKGLLLK